MIDRPFIAVVDDDPSVRKALDRLLRTAGMQVATYPSAERFLLSLDRGAPDCLVLDIRMPGITGLDLRDRLVALKQRIPIVFITAHAEDVAAEGSVLGKSVDILHKPFDDKVLIEAIGRSIRPRDSN
jgi:FixJ family two-component response regulator